MNLTGREYRSILGKSRRPKGRLLRWAVTVTVSGEAAARSSGGYFHHRARRPVNPQVTDVGLQERLLALCGEMTGVAFPPSGVAGGMEDDRRAPL